MARLGRNDPCSCGSGKKYKHCCLGKSHCAPDKTNDAAGDGSADGDASIHAALAHLREGRLAQAEALYQSVAQDKIGHSESFHLLGVVALQLGKIDNAIELLGKAVDADPSREIYSLNLGSAFQAKGLLDDAIACYSTAARINPECAEAYNNMGVAFKIRNRLDDAIRCYRRALTIRPDYVDAHNNLGNALLAQGKPEEAVPCYRQAIAVKEDHSEAYCNLGSAFQAQGRFNEAMANFRRAISLKPRDAVLHYNLGNVLREKGQWEEAIASYRRALSFRPDYPDAHCNLIFALDMTPEVDTRALQMERRRWCELHANEQSDFSPSLNAPDPERRLRVGYVSADFRQHSAAIVFGAMLMCFDAARFDVIAYSNSNIEDEYSLLFRNKVTAWRNIAGLTDDDVVETIRCDRIDILVDLSGHSAGNRLRVFARKPAPIQVTAWGYAGGTGMRAMDVFFADPVVVPREEAGLYAEEVRYLPSIVCAFFPNRFPDVVPLPALKRGYVTFGSLNRLCKVSQEAFSAWTKILEAIPDSRLIIKAGELDSKEERLRVIEQFTRDGISPERVTLMGKSTWHDHVAAFNQIDISLDSFPHGGGVTTLEGMVMGVPVVTLRWPTLPGRLSASMLTTLGLTDWIATSPEGYVDIAIRKARDLATLTRLRQQLRSRFMTSPLGDAPAYVRIVEQEYRTLWRERCAMHAANRVSDVDGNRHGDAPVAQRDGGIVEGKGKADYAATDTSSFPAQNLERALGLHRAGRLSEAEKVYLEILEEFPECADALHLLGYIHFQRANHELAIDFIARAIQANPEKAIFYFNLGNAFHARGCLEEAADNYRQAPRVDPAFAVAYCSLGNVFQKQGKLTDAIASYRQSLTLQPMLAEAANNLGNVFKTQGALHDAEACYRQALAARPDLAEAYKNLGVVLQHQGRLDDAISSYRQAILKRPDYSEALNNLGIACQRQGRVAEAIDCYRQALEKAPQYAEAFNNLGMAFVEQGRLDEACSCYRQAIVIKPDYAVAHSNLIFALDLMPGLTTQTLQEERQRWDAVHTAGIKPHASFCNIVDPERRLRVGYVSADFGQHSAAVVFGAMLKYFNTAEFDVIAYANIVHEDDCTRLFQQSVTGWRRVAGLSDEALAELVRQDGIDILVDLSGHTAGNRLMVFAHKPAPIQITAWGYIGGTGMKTMDVFLADRVVVPPEERDFFAEDVRYLPSIVSAFFPFPFPAVNATPAREGAVTFGSLNRLCKLSDETLRVWADLLREIPGSRMILKGIGLDDDISRARVAGHFIKAGIAPERIILRGRTPWFEHMQVFNEIDIAIDPFPHGGGVTAMEGLMMGVPIVALRSPTVPGRLSASILTTLGLSDWIAETPSQYVELAIRKSRDLQALGDLRRQLRSRFTGAIIGDTVAYVRIVEREYRALWREWCVRAG